MQTVAACPLCAGTILQSYRRSRSFAKCADCRLVVRVPFPAESDLKHLYVAAWISPGQHSTETGNMYEGLADQYIEQLKTSLGIGSLAGLRILDFGAGKGILMEALREQGADVIGIEPYGYEMLKARGLSVFRSIDELPADDPFDGIISMDVAEHLREPWVLFQSLRAFLTPGGWLLISTPNPDGLNARIRGRNWRELQKPGHILFMAEGTLFRMLQCAGYRDVRPVRWFVRYSPGTIRSFGWRLLCRLGFGGATRVLAFK